MSAMNLCGRKWHIGAEDMFLPAVYSMCFNIPLLAITAVIYATVEPSCGDVGLSHRLGVYTLGFLVLYALSTIFDIIIMIVAMRTKLLERNTVMHFCIYFRTGLSIALMLFTVVGSLWIHSISEDSCMETHPKTLTLNYVVLAISWLVFLSSLTFLYCVSSKATHNSEYLWTRRLRFWTCACLWGQAATENDPMLFDDIGKELEYLFQPKGVVASDVLVGLMLVKAMQVEQAKRGLRHFFLSAKDYSPDVAKLASNGQQPELKPNDWERFEEAQYFIKYAVAAYGWPLYTIMRPMQVVFCGDLFGCMLSKQLSDEQKEHYIGKNRVCMHSSLTAFMKRADVKLNDILHIHLVNDINQVCYYICKDTKRNALVLAIRGTLSMQDTVTDLQAACVPTDELGLPGHYTHRGIKRVVANLINDLEKHQVIDTFLKNNPNYRLVITGHSLGSACTALVTLILSKKYANIRGICIAPPSIGNEELAQSDKARELITSIVYNKDIVCRLSLKNMLNVRADIMQAFTLAKVSSKFDIWRRSQQRHYEDMVQLDEKFNDNQYLDINAIEEHDIDTTPLAKRNEIAHYGTTKGENKQKSELKENLLSFTEEMKVRERVRSLHIAHRRVSSHSHHQKAEETWKQMHLPGRIFHIVRKRAPPEQRYCCDVFGADPKYAVYVADHRVFLDIMVDPSMMTDHMPNIYLDRIHKISIPNQNIQIEMPDDII